MDVAGFKKQIDVFGEKKLIAIVYDNSSRETYTQENHFEWDLHVNEETETVIQYNHDGKGNPYNVHSPIENIQKLIFATDQTDWTKIDWRDMNS